jgi:hypothetical protein
MLFWLEQDLGLAKKMRMIQEQIEREQKEAEARIPKAQPLPYTTKSPIVSHCTIDPLFALRDSGGFYE